ncbi:MAG: helix-turn-helix domain-containing protein [Desulfobacteraceae bacterium]|nr:helix-turn-helix domain-containing protein [Desulfobacteraceae bacterium]
MSEQNFLTVGELAETLRVPKSWVYGKTRQSGPGCIPKVQVGKYIRFRLNEVMEWIERKQDE